MTATGVGRESGGVRVRGLGGSRTALGGWRMGAPFDLSAFYRIYLVRFGDAGSQRARSFLLYFRQLAVPKLVKPAGSVTTKRGASGDEMPG